MQRIPMALAAVILVVAACGDDAGTTSTTAPLLGSADVTTATAAPDDHAMGDGGMDDGHMDEGENDDGAHDDHDDEPMGEFLSAEFVPAATGPVTAEISVVLDDFSITPEHLDLVPGETVRMEIRNDGAIGHEFRLTTQHRVEEHLASGHADHSSEGGHHGEADIIVNVRAGEIRTVEFTLPEDADAIDLMACLLVGHYEAGMYGGVSF